LAGGAEFLWNLLFVGLHAPAEEKFCRSTPVLALPILQAVPAGLSPVFAPYLHPV
jgi:hypothetical protein